ncbi:plasmid pRiA4b ORF-3 family protein [bacterium]|nr:plasmid pRiA4b ORF-3 family protein [bacterium]
MCTGGKRACPPEDCGGIFGYENLLKILSNPKHPEYKSILSWVGGKFDPEYFNFKEVVFDDHDERWDFAPSSQTE